MAKYLTEREAWKMMGMAYDKHPTKRGWLQQVLAEDGMCDAIGQLYRQDYIHWGIVRQMKDNLSACRKIGSYWWGRNVRKSDHLRSAFCLGMYYSLGGE